jgi:hypothetical protein
MSRLADPARQRRLTSFLDVKHSDQLESRDTAVTVYALMRFAFDVSLRARVPMSGIVLLRCQ